MSKGLALMLGIGLLTSIPLGALADEDEHERFRADCRYHNVENHPGVKFCYASAVYRVHDRKRIRDIKFGVGCDFQTIYNDNGIITPIETVGDRITPPTAATPAVEVVPQNALAVEGTYSSVLDTSFGRMNGTCYVRKIEREHDSYARIYFDSP